MCDYGAEIDCQTHIKNTPLNLASQKGHIEIVKLLIHHKANINTPDEDNLTPLHNAVHYGHLEVTELLIQNNAQLNCQSKKNKNTPLHLASMVGQIDTAHWLEIGITCSVILRGIQLTQMH